MRLLRGQPARVYVLAVNSGQVPEEDRAPMLDRFDIHIEVPPIECAMLADERLGGLRSALRARVEAARHKQQERFEHLP